jgi:two-component system sensor histidine kinase KdpD
MAHDLAADGDERALLIEEEAERLSVLVTNMLDLSRLDSGASMLVPEANEAEDLLGAALQRVTGAANGREIRVSLDAGEPLLFGRFDFTQTLRALVNLIENALKHSPPGNAIDVAVRREPDWLAFSVLDRGPGVPEEERERIFEPFYRGLGLSIARSVANAQGGSLTYAPREGGGSAFTIRVPALDVEDVSRA